MQFTVSYLGQTSIICDFGSTLSPELHKQVLALFHAVQDVFNCANAIPSPNKLVVEFFTANETTKAYKKIQSLKIVVNQLESNHWLIPACYEKDFGLDQDLIVKQTGTDIEQLIHEHSNTVFYSYGFGGTPGQLRLGNTKTCAPGKLNKPRQHVPAGSIGWSKLLCNSYPVETAGGWPIFCRIPVYSNNFVDPGDTVKFYRVDRAEIEKQNDTIKVS